MKYGDLVLIKYREGIGEHEVLVNVSELEKEKSVVVQKQLTMPAIKQWEILLNDTRTKQGMYQQAVDFYMKKGYDISTIEEVITQFIAYWSEPTLSGKKMRWQTEKTFDIGRRLNTFFLNHEKFGGVKTKTEGQTWASI